MNAATAGTIDVGGDLTVNRLGFGAMRVTGRGIWGDPRNRDEAIAVLRRVIELGINFIDTANSYGPHVSESLIAEALFPYPEDLVIATKGGLERPGPNSWTPNGRPEHLIEECEGSLRRLKLDQIPLYQLHRVDPAVPLEDSIGALVTLKEQGKIRHIGVSNFHEQQLRRAQKLTPIVSIQNRYNFSDRRSEDLVDLCEQEQLAFLPWAPIQDTDAKWHVRQIAEAHQATPRQIILAWLLARSPMILPIPGTGSVAHLEENVAALEVKLSADEVSMLASRMTLKQRVLGLNVDGAKCGIDFDPRHEGAKDALGRFMSFLSDELRTRFSMGPDMGTKWHELQQLAARAGVPSIKYAIKNAQGLSDTEFFTRIGRLDDRVGPLTLTQRRAGHALAHTAIGAARAAGVTGQITCALQGFGNLGLATACSLAEEDVRLTAVGDENGCIADPRGLDVGGMLRSSLGATVPQLLTRGERLPAQELFRRPADVLILAACADAMSERDTASPPFHCVVVGANCGLSDDAEEALHTRGVLVVPDFIGGIGGSASMEALFGPAQPPSAAQVLDNLACMMRDLVDDLITTARRESTAPRIVAARLAARESGDPQAPPYGQCRYLTATVH